MMIHTSLTHRVGHNGMDSDTLVVLLEAYTHADSSSSLPGYRPAPSTTKLQVLTLSGLQPTTNAPSTTGLTTVSLAVVSFSTTAHTVIEKALHSILTKLIAYLMPSLRLVEKIRGLTSDHRVKVGTSRSETYFS